MSNEVIILMIEAMVMYFLVLAAHSLRHRFGPVHFYALIGGVTAIMSWVTDAGLVVNWGDITFVVGSTVFYTSLLLGVFVVYVFDGPRVTRITISTVIVVSIMMPLIAAALHFQAALIGGAPIANVPLPSLRINAASVIATLLDLIFLAMAWEFLGKPGFRMGLWFRTWLTLLGVMWLDVFLFATGAFVGTDAYWNIMQGTLISRFIISLVALPFLYGYLYWQSNMKGIPLENRPVLAILRQVAEIEAELSLAQQEIARRKQAEATLRESEERFRVVMKGSGIVAAIADRDLRYVWIQHPDPDFDAEAVVGKRDDELADDPGMRQLMALKRQVLQRERGARAEITLHNTGGPVTYDVTAEPLRDSDGAVIGVTTAALDISERKQAQEALQEANARLIRQERLAAVGQLTTGLAHVFNNLLAAMTLHVAIARNKQAAGISVDRVLEMLKDDVSEAAALVQKLLEFSRKAIMRPQQIDLASLLREQVAQLHKETPSGMKVILEAHDQSVDADADPALLEEVVQNLVQNARAAMNGDGTLHIELQVVEADGDCYICHRPVAGEWARIKFADDGAGIPEENLPHIFEPFFTTDSPAHNGLGLSQVVGIVKQHGGHLDVDSTAGVGTVVTVYLPPHGKEDAPCAVPQDQQRLASPSPLREGNGATKSKSASSTDK